MSWRFIKDHGDDLVDMLERVPEILGKAGIGLSAAGSSAVKASGFLTGDDGGVDVRELAETAASALNRCHDQLKGATDLLARLGDQIDDIKIPTLSTSHTEIMGFSVVTGIDLGESSIAGDAAGSLRSGADRLVDVAEDLQTVAEKLLGLGGAIGDAGADLRVVGGDLETSGTALVAMTGPAKKTTARKRTSKKRAARKTPAKKTTARKTSARKSKARKTPAKKAATRKTAAKKTPPRKSPAKKSTAKKKAPTKRAAPKKASGTAMLAKKSPTKKASKK